MGCAASNTNPTSKKTQPDVERNRTEAAGSSELSSHPQNHVDHTANSSNPCSLHRQGSKTPLHVVSPALEKEQHETTTTMLSDNDMEEDCPLDFASFECIDGSTSAGQSASSLRSCDFSIGISTSTAGSGSNTSNSSSSHRIALRPQRSNKSTRFKSILEDMEKFNASMEQRELEEAMQSRDTFDTSSSVEEIEAPVRRGRRLSSLIPQRIPTPTKLITEQEPNTKTRMPIDHNPSPPQDQVKQDATPPSANNGCIIVDNVKPASTAELNLGAFIADNNPLDAVPLMESISTCSSSLLTTPSGSTGDSKGTLPDVVVDINDPPRE